jgi:hypothetical protein
MSQNYNKILAKRTVFSIILKIKPRSRPTQKKIPHILGTPIFQQPK